MNDLERSRLIDRLERLGEQRVRLFSAVDCERFFGGWQVREAIEGWLDGKEAARRGPVRRSFRLLSLF
ncbi:MAG: hypothetical protein P4M00_11025 [Azospirillaceae bacterium]|nr:hypothetical protein [Azospirillaceae bacterium]